MANTTEHSADEALTPESFEQLAKTNTNKWLTIFLSNAVDGPPDREETIDLRIDQADEYREFSDEVKYLGLHLEEVESEGGYEGAGEHAEIIFAIKRNEEVITHFRITGYYSSYDGTEWNDSVTRVEPREVLVTQYHEVE